MEIRKNTVLWGVVGILFIVALFMMFSAGASGTVGNTVQATAPAVQQASSGMVGGC